MDEVNSLQWHSTEGVSPSHEVEHMIALAEGLVNIGDGNNKRFFGMSNMYKYHMTSYSGYDTLMLVKRMIPDLKVSWVHRGTFYVCFIHGNTAQGIHGIGSTLLEAKTAACFNIFSIRKFRQMVKCIDNRKVEDSVVKVMESDSKFIVNGVSAKTLMMQKYGNVFVEDSELVGDNYNVSVKFMDTKFQKDNVSKRTGFQLVWTALRDYLYEENGVLGRNAVDYYEIACVQSYLIMFNAYLNDKFPLMKVECDLLLHRNGMFIKNLSEVTCSGNTNDFVFKFLNYPDVRIYVLREIVNHYRINGGGVPLNFC